MRLIDADRLKRQVEGRSWRAKGKMIELIDDSPTIRVGENTCKHRTPDGVCKLYTDEHFTSFCVDGPCPNEEPITEDEAPDVKHGRWIPVSERLPEEDTEVLISYRYKEGEGDTSHVDIDITTYGQMYFGGNKVGNNKHWRAPFEYFYSNYEVIAWMPLPEPYKEEAETKDEP